jgi:DNA-binding response OmpR family regulator
MRANPEVLILEDDAETLEGLQSHFTRKRFHPLAARSASRALSLLEHNRYASRPVLAIVDWDLGKAPDRMSGHRLLAEHRRVQRAQPDPALASTCAAA